MTLSIPKPSLIPLNTPLSVGQIVRVQFPNSMSPGPVPKRVHHPKRPADPRDGNYEIIQIDESRQLYWIKTLGDVRQITIAKRGYIKDFASEAVAA
jgi:hypothetical protein|tara:strand:- start:82 stop:369 length:288 start_codon:yes stop_codon:yes gene_type:complete